MKFRLPLALGLLAALSAFTALLPLYYPAAPVGRAVAAGPELVLDADTSNGGPCATIDPAITVKPGQPFQVGLCLRGLTGPVTSFQFDIVYDDTIISAPEVALAGQALDDNPDANAGSTTWGDSLGEDWSCNVLDMGQQPVGDNDSASGPGHGLAQMVCWTLTGTTTLGDNEDSGVLAVVSFNGAPSNMGTTTIELANVAMYTSDILEIGSCNPTISTDMTCRGVSVTVSGETIPPDQWPTATPASGETKRTYSPSGELQLTAEPTPGVSFMTPTTAQPAANATMPPTKTEEAAKTAEAAKATPTTNETEKNGDNGWVLPAVIGVVAAVVVIGGASLAFYLRRRGQTL